MINNLKKVLVSLLVALFLFSCSNGIQAPVASEKSQVATRAVDKGDWEAGVSYFGDWPGVSGDLVVYEGNLWRCKFSHTSQSDWYPGAPGLWFWEDLGAHITDPISVLTCYWTFDPAVEIVEPTGPTTPILVGSPDSAINWDTMEVSSVAVAEASTGAVWFKESLWERYQMEGCGFLDEDGDGTNDYVIQLNETIFTYTGQDVSFTAPDGTVFNLVNGQENITLFVLLDINDCQWGKAWDDQNQVESDLIPWKSAAVTTNVEAGLDKEIYFPFIDGFEYYDIENPGQVLVHDGKFIPHDSSWSFSEEDMNSPENDGLDCWIDLYVGTYDNYLLLDEYMSDLLSNNSPYLDMQPVYRWGSYEDFYVGPVRGTGIAGR